MSLWFGPVGSTMDLCGQQQPPELCWLWGMLCAGWVPANSEHPKAAEENPKGHFYGRWGCTSDGKNVPGIWSRVVAWQPQGWADPGVSPFLQEFGEHQLVDPCGVQE